MYLDELKNTYGLQSVASLCGVSERTIQRWIQNGTFPKPQTIGGMLRWSCTDVRAWLAAAGDVETALRELVDALSKIAEDPDESVRGRRWASERLAEIRSGEPTALRAVARLSR